MENKNQQLISKIRMNTGKNLTGLIGEIIPTTTIGCDECNNRGYITFYRKGYPFEEECKCLKEFKLTKIKTKSRIPDIYMNAKFDLDESVRFYRHKPLNYIKATRKINGEDKVRKELQFSNPVVCNINAFAKQYSDISTKYLKEIPRLNSVGLILSGAVGSGKTYISCAIGNSLIEQKFNVRYYKAKQYMDVIRGTFSKDPSESSSSIQTRNLLNGSGEFKDICHLLILDELGFEYQSETGFALSEIKDLLRNRAEKRLPTIITTNFLLNELSSTYEEELLSMFAESYMFFSVICPDDYRLKKSAELDKDFDFDNLML